MNAIAPQQVEAAPGYCSSTGGDSSYERITNVNLTKYPTGNYRINANVFIANPSGCITAESCPAYDLSPEYVNAWIDFNGNKIWEDSEKVMDVALSGYLGINYFGTMSAIAQFVPPVSITRTTWMRANLGWGDDPNDVCQLTWKWGNVVDQQVTFYIPQIKEIKATGSKDLNNPMTTYDVVLQAVLEVPADYEVVKVSWTGDLKPGDGNPYIYKPDKGTHGLKKITATLTFRDKASGQIGQTTKDFEFKLFFEKKGDDNGNSKPNWFEYWGTDGAVPGLNNSLVTYDATKGAGSYGAWSPSTDKVELGPAAAETHYPGGLTISGVTYGNVKGIDSVSEVIAHELRHRTTIKVNWGAGGSWVGKADSDFQVPTNAYYDKLPNDYEETFGTDKTKTDSKDLEHIKSAVYKYYGDNEYDAIVAGHNQKGNANKDWSNPGKQSNPAFLAMSPASVANAEAQSSGPVAPAAPLGTNESALPGIGTLTGNYSSAGIDTDNNGLFETLRITVGVNINVTGSYNVVGWLKGSGGANIAYANHTLTLAPGAHSATLDFDGKLIQQSGVAGPYTLARVELRAEDHDDLLDAADNAYATPAFSPGNFTPPEVVFTGGYGDAGLDTDSNTKFNQLIINVGVQVNQPGVYSLIGWLYDSNGNPIPNGSASAQVNGSGTYALAFDGRLLGWNGLNGPYRLGQLEVRNASQQRVAFATTPYTTVTPYTAGQFETPVVQMNAASYADQGVDANADGAFDYLRITFSATVPNTDTYQLNAVLKNREATTIGTLREAIVLNAGSNNITLDFPAGPINLGQVNGPYSVDSILFLDANGNLAGGQQSAHTTQPYSYTAFAKPLIAFTNQFSDDAVDVTNDNTKDELDIQIGTLPGNNGVVIAQGFLVDKNNKVIASASITQAVQSGVATMVTLPFSATAILNNGVDGPYFLRDLLVYHTGDPNQSIYLSNAHTTKSYSHVDLSLLADLTVGKTGPAKANLGRTLTYNLSVLNAGSGTAVTIQLTDTLPDGFIYVSDNSGVTPTVSGQQVTWNLNALGANGSITFAVIVRPTKTGTFTNVVNATTSAAEITAANNTASATTRITGEVYMPLVQR